MHGHEYVLAVVVFCFIAEFKRFIHARACPAGDGCAAESFACVDINFNGGIAARIENLARFYVRYFCWHCYDPFFLFKWGLTPIYVLLR